MRLEINGWSSKITFSATHIIPGHQKCGRLHGHDYAINAAVFGVVGVGGVIVDFISLKEFLRGVANELDHKILIPMKDTSVEISGDTVRYTACGKHYSFPKVDCALLDLEVASAEGLAEYVLRTLLSKMKFPANVKRVELGVDEGRGQGVWTGLDL